MKVTLHVEKTEATALYKQEWHRSSAQRVHVSVSVSVFVLQQDAVRATRMRVESRITVMTEAKPKVEVEV